MLDWLIIGGGVHGTYVSGFLARIAGAPRDRLRVLDPHETPLAVWEACTRNTGMTYLRSPVVHHLDPMAMGLYEFARAQGFGEDAFTRPYNRPSLDLFRAHSRHVIGTGGLDRLRIRGRALSLLRRDGGFRIETERGGLESRRIVLALGASERPWWPAWARALRSEHLPIDHVFDAGFSLDRLQNWAHAVVVGGGLTAAQTALTLARRAPGTVTLVSRHPTRIRRFDASPGWMGPKHLTAFWQEPDYRVRRRIIRRARHRGSVTPEVAREIEAATESGLLRHVRDEVAGARPFGDRSVVVDLASCGRLPADRILLATGFDARRPGGPLLDVAIQDLGLRCADCGYPIVDAALQWHPGIHVTGPLAELEVGPASRNIAGARMAAGRIAQAA